MPDEHGVTIIEDMGEAPEEYTSEDYSYVLHILKRNAGAAYFYALYVLKGRWEDGESKIMKDPLYAYFYARDVLKNDPTWPHKNGRWPEAEPYIMEDPASTYRYTEKVLRHRWPEAEHVIKQQLWAWNKYKKLFKVE